MELFLILIKGWKKKEYDEKVIIAEYFNCSVKR